MIATLGSVSDTQELARARNKDGRFRQKRADTHLGTLEAQYGEISDRRSDTHLGTLREVTGMSLSKMVRTHMVEVTHHEGINGRSRNQDGRIRAKNGSTHLGTLEKQYGEISSLPDNTHLSVLCSMVGGHSLTWILQNRDALPQG